MPNPNTSETSTYANAGTGFLGSNDALQRISGTRHTQEVSATLRANWGGLRVAAEHPTKGDREGVHEHAVMVP